MSGALQNARCLQGWAPALHGIFLRSDLAQLLQASSPPALDQKLRPLLREGLLSRYCPGVYLWIDPARPTPRAAPANPTSDLRHDSQLLARLAHRLHPLGILSLGYALERHLMIGTQSPFNVEILRPGKSRLYAGAPGRVQALALDPSLLFGWELQDGLRIADPAKALLDTLYYAQHGRTYPFDLATDIAIEIVDIHLFANYLSHYRNPRFQAYATRWLHEHR